MPRKTAAKAGRPLPEARLQGMSVEEYAPYVEDLIRRYAADHVRGGRWTPEESLGAARKEVEHLLPRGPQTPQQHLFTIRAPPGGRRVGVLWVHVDPPKGFIYDLIVETAERRKGFGRAAMVAAETVARERGAATLSLHVFAHNEGARSLYQALGYRETNVVMSKTLPP